MIHNTKATIEGVGTYTLKEIKAAFEMSGEVLLQCFDRYQVPNHRTQYEKNKETWERVYYSLTIEILKSGLTGEHFKIRDFAETKLKDVMENLGVKPKILVSDPNSIP